MNLDNDDFALIEQALREGVNQGSDYQKVLAYQAVLNKLQTAPDISGKVEQAAIDRLEMDDGT